MIVSAWANGRHAPTGVGYGLKVSAADRDRHFNRDIEKVSIFLPGLSQPVAVNTAKKSFWNGTCRELISKDIRDWLWRNGYAPWPVGDPPKFILTPLGDNVFRLEAEGMTP